MSTALDRILEEIKALTPEERGQLLAQLEKDKRTLEQREAPAEGQLSGRGGRTIWEEIAELSRQAPPEEWAKLDGELSLVRPS